MQGELWQDYGASGTYALGREEIEQAIARLERMWDDAQAHAHDDRVVSTPDCCDCCHRRTS
jgi:hypothetical protein